MKKIPENRKKEIEKKLTTIAERVAKKPVYVLSKSFHGYDIVHYITQHALLSGLPELAIAKRLVEKANTKKSLSVGEINSINKKLKEYYKHFNDIQFYMHTVKNSTDEFKIDAVRTRLDISRFLLQQVKRSLRI
jgi:hypothetical protein